MKESRLYSLFEKREGKWVRISTYAFTKTVAVKHYQNRLLDGLFSGVTRELKVVKS